MRRRKHAFGAIAPAALLFCAFADGDASAAAAAVPVVPGAGQQAPSELKFLAAGPPPGFVRPSVTAVRIDTAEAPVIDADLSDAVWAKATVIDNFTQKQPNPVCGRRPSARWCASSTTRTISISRSTITTARPTAIIARSMQRDGPLFTANSVMLYIDPGQTRRNAYNFEIGASGGRTDQLELNNTEELREWDTIWEGRARIVAGRLGGGDRDPVQEPVL